MKKFSDLIKDAKSPKVVLYHLSYDIIGNNKNKPENPIEFILTILKELGAKDVERHSESSLIISFDLIPTSIFKVFNDKLSPFFYYSISQIGRKPDENIILDNNSNDTLNKNIKKIFKDIII